MKRRLTYVLNDITSFNLNQLNVGTTSFGANGIQGAKEEHLTFSVDELPGELREVLRQCHELHIRWISSLPYVAHSPYLSRLSPGLHVFYTPQRHQRPPDLCTSLKSLFGTDLKCYDQDRSFTSASVLSGRFSLTSTYSYYQYLESLQGFTTYLSREVCNVARNREECQEFVAKLRGAQYVDMDYDAISNTIIGKVYWAKPESDRGWTENSLLGKDKSSLEVGILTSEKPDSDEPDSLKLGGFLVAVGRDTEPKQTLFSFPARFHPFISSNVSPSYRVSIQEPSGLHPTVRITLERHPEPPLSNRACALHTYMVLPSGFFIDRYQFKDPLFLSTHHLVALRSLVGASDLEAPDWIIDQWGSAALFELANSGDPDIKDGEEWLITIPLHLRYLTPTPGMSGLANLKLPWPVVFWACEAEEGLKFSTSPFDRGNLGYDGLFGPKTMFYHLSPALARNETASASTLGRHSSPLAETIAVPALDLSNPWAPYLENGTLLAVLLGILWLLWCLWRPQAQRNDLNRALHPKKSQ